MVRILLVALFCSIAPISSYADIVLGGDFGKGWGSYSTKNKTLDSSPESISNSFVFYNAYLGYTFNEDAKDWSGFYLNYEKLTLKDKLDKETQADGLLLEVKIGLDEYYPAYIALGTGAYSTKDLHATNKTVLGAGIKLGPGVKLNLTDYLAMDVALKYHYIGWQKIEREYLDGSSEQFSHYQSGATLSLGLAFNL